MVIVFWLNKADLYPDVKPIRLNRNSIRSEIGIFLFSKIVLVSGLNLLPQHLHLYVWMPSFLFPNLIMFLELQKGHSTISMSFINYISVLETVGYLFSYRVSVVSLISKS